jgi:hypothetical protein
MTLLSQIKLLRVGNKFPAGKTGICHRWESAKAHTFGLAASDDSALEGQLISI